MRVDYLGLEAFVSIGEQGNFKRAAAHLNLSPTALSHRIKKLEQDLGVTLVLRTTRSVSLSSAGVDLLPRARRAIADMQVSYTELRRIGSAKEQRVALACLPTLAINYLTPVLRGFRQDHPGTEVQVHDVSMAEILALLRRGEAEFGLTIVSAIPDDIEIQPLLSEPYVVACAEDHPLAGQAAVTWADLERCPLVRFSTRAGNRGVIDDALGARREQLDWRYEVQRLATAVSLVQAGLALAIVPQVTVRGYRSDGVVTLPLRNPSIGRQIGIAQRPGHVGSAAAADLRQRLAQHIAATGAG